MKYSFLSSLKSGLGGLFSETRLHPVVSRVFLPCVTFLRGKKHYKCDQDKAIAEKKLPPRDKTLSLLFCPLATQGSLHSRLGTVVLGFSALNLLL